MIIKHYIQKFLKSEINIYNNEKISKNSIVRDYNKIKSYLLANFEEDEIIALYLHKNHYYPLIIIACMEIGLTYIPLRDDFPKERVGQIQSISNFKTLLTQNDVENILKSNFYTDKIEFAIYDDKPLYMMFTSGSTGEPKGVIIQRKAYQNFLEWVDKYFSHITKDDKLLNSTDYTFDVSLLDISLLLSKHIHFFISNFNRNIFKMMYELQTYEITTIATVPNNFHLILSNNMVDKVNLSKLNTVLMAGSVFDVHLYEKFKKQLRVNVYNCYGPTEATVYCLVKKLSFNKEEDVCNNVVSIGTPILGMNAKVIDDELLITGKQLMKEYLNNSSKTEEVLIKIGENIFYKTGDIAFKNENGDYFVNGRKDDTIKVAGYRVSLSDIDFYIKKVDEVEDSVTVAIKDELKGHYLVSFIILKQNISKGELFIKLKNIMLDYQIPSHINFVSKFPLNSSEKICKKSLKEIFQNAF